MENGYDEFNNFKFQHRYEQVLILNHVIAYRMDSVNQKYKLTTREKLAIKLMYGNSRIITITIDPQKFSWVYGITNNI